MAQAVTARLYITPKQLADLDRPASKRTVSVMLFDSEGKKVRGFQPSKMHKGRISLGGCLDGMVLTVKSSGSFGQEDVNAKFRSSFQKILEQLSATDEHGQLAGYCDVPAEIEMLKGAQDARSIALELGL
jgi:hypothetical protein